MLLSLMLRRHALSGWISETLEARRSSNSFHHGCPNASQCIRTLKESCLESTNKTEHPYLRYFISEWPPNTGNLEKDREIVEEHGLKVFNELERFVEAYIIIVVLIDENTSARLSSLKIIFLIQHHRRLLPGGRRSQYRREVRLLIGCPVFPLEF